MKITIELGWRVASFPPLPFTEEHFLEDTWGRKWAIISVAEGETLFLARVLMNHPSEVGIKQDFADLAIAQSWCEERVYDLASQPFIC